ncbi:FMN-dependent NADH-azoreductase [Ahrensia marina]|uniref:FMN dependent NADH:quinone oxidoreductase n=1 Tax=Ahrensia marina TaxID=1514904 RepID=A0A0M9GNM5_9HYPH|nr:NAD(P)H-dependent oxidoreductase [Ahrensia marina]KPB01726.1 FMN-dependent NADH-azoreductase [Ahrensia marina]
MPTLLSIQSSARHENSHSRDLSKELIAKLNKQGEFDVKERDLAETIPHISEKWLGANWTPKDDRNDEQKAHLALSDTLIEQLKAADVLVFGAPIYNFSVPAALKAWIDMVCRAGDTFRYTENGPEGLLKGKKAYIVIASGGVPVDSAYDYATPYLRQVLGFIGITDVEIIAADGLVANEAASLAKANAEIERLAA